MKQYRNICGMIVRNTIINQISKYFPMFRKHIHDVYSLSFNYDLSTRYAGHIIMTDYLPILIYIYI